MSTGLKLATAPTQVPKSLGWSLASYLYEGNLVQMRSPRARLKICLGVGVVEVRQDKNFLHRTMLSSGIGQNKIQFG